MQCPACSGALAPVAAGSLTVDVCAAGCGGIWFDRTELQKVDEAFEAEGDALAGLPAPAGARPDPARRYACPCCDRIVMMRHFTSVLHDVEVDECPGCGGFWLDAGELARLRAENRDPDDREKLQTAATQSPVAAEFAARSQANVEACRSVTRICRLLRVRAPYI
jgi:Zn-finger nucleic acid-binding protein